MDFFHGTFKYEEVIYSKMGDVPVIVEKFIPGKFIKLINNTGNICRVDDDNIEIQKKAESLVHFSLSDSKEKMMLVDIQGVGLVLCDPEIATAERATTDGEWNFCSGNLGCLSINAFKSAHVCNAYCTMVGLAKFPAPSATTTGVPTI